MFIEKVKTWFKDMMFLLLVATERQYVDIDPTISNTNYYTLVTN